MIILKRLFRVRIVKHQLSVPNLSKWSFAGLVAHLGTFTRNTMRVPTNRQHRFTLYPRPTPLQEAAFRLLDLDPDRVQ